MIGSTVKTVGGIHKAFYWGDELGCDSVQFYLTLSRRWEINELTTEEVALFKDEWKASRVKEVVVHIPYLVNLASKERGLWEKSLKRMKGEVERANLLGVKYLVLHPGSTDDNGGLKRIKEAFDRIDLGDAKVLIETMAGQGNSLGGTLEEVADIVYLLGREENIGVCFDTAHLFQAGYNIQDYEAFLNHFNSLIPLEKIWTFHLNDSKTDCGSRVDRHENIGEGKIGLEYFRKLLNDKRFVGIPKIIETPDTKDGGSGSLELLKSLIR